MKLINISTPKFPNTFTMVDDADYEWLSQWKWRMDKNGYVCRRNEANGSPMLLHRELLRAAPGVPGDHINGDRLDNQRCNLRVCSIAENSRNRHRKIKGTSSIYKGVYWEKSTSRFRATIRVNYRKIHLGRFKIEALAGAAYNLAAEKYFGEFASLNKIAG